MILRRSDFPVLISYTSRREDDFFYLPDSVVREHDLLEGFPDFTSGFLDLNLVFFKEVLIETVLSIVRRS